MTEEQDTATTTGRRRRSRQETEQDLLDAALRLMRRDGVLAGVNLREVAKEAGVNHGQIYQYFGTRQTLLRAAIAHLVANDFLDRDSHWDKPFADRRKAMWRAALGKPDVVRLEALLALDNDPGFDLFPDLPRTSAALDRDRADGALPPDADGVVMHAMTASTYLGYCIFRDAIARGLDITPDELDRRSEAVFDRMLSGLTATPDQD